MELSDRQLFNDGTIPAQSSIDFHTQLHALGVPSSLTLIQGADHAFDDADVVGADRAAFERLRAR